MRIDFEETLEHVIERVQEGVRWAWYWVIWRRPPPSAEIVEIEPLEMRDIVFTPLTPTTATAATLPSRDVALICPVTRQPVKPGNGAYQCTNCKMAYSLEGWQFLRENARGRCCGCNGKNTVIPLG